MSMQTHFLVSHELHLKIGVLHEKLVEVTREFFVVWKEDILFTSAWWISVGLSILPWLLWMKFRKKESSARLLFAGFFVVII